MKFEITIPVLDEEETLREKVLEAHAYVLSHITPYFKIIITDNGSKDKTPVIGEQLAKDYPEIEFLKVSKRGVGLALRTSWMKSTADLVGYMDLDLATDLKHLKEVYNLFNEQPSVQIINGSRLLKGSKVINRTKTRDITSVGFNIIVKSLLGVKLSDGMCGFKFFRRPIAQELINTGIHIDGWFFSTEILVKSIWKGIAIHEIPVKWTDIGTSKVNIRKLSIEYLKQIWRLRKEKKDWVKKHKRN